MCFYEVKGGWNLQYLCRAGFITSTVKVILQLNNHHLIT